MKKSTKVLLGAVTFWPFIYIPLFMLTIFSMILFNGPGKEPPDAFPLIFLLIFPIHILTIFAIIGVKIFYIVNIFRNPKVEKDKQVLWVVLLILAGLIAEPIYWYLYIWRDTPQASAEYTPKELNNADAASWRDPAAANQRERDFSTPPPPHSWRD